MQPFTEQPVFKDLRARQTNAHTCGLVEEWRQTRTSW